MTENIPYSLALRIVRICSLTEDREERFLELRDLLLSTDYKPKLISSAIDRARNVPRHEALKRVVKEKTSNRLVFVINYDPRLPSIPAIVKRHCTTMIQDPRLAEVFPLPPLVAYKRPPNIRDKLIRAKVPPMPSSRPRREVKGMRKCLKCATCPFVREGKSTTGFFIFTS